MSEDLSGSHFTRTLTAPERAVYRELAAEWAVLDAKAQATLYAMLLDDRGVLARPDMIPCKTSWWQRWLAGEYE